MFDELADLRRLSSGSILIWLIIGSYVEFLNFYIDTCRKPPLWIFFRVQYLEKCAVMA